MKDDLLENNDIVSDMNVIPFIDVVLVLLFVFMATIAISNSSIEVSLPKVTVEERVTSENSLDELLVVTIDSSDKIFISSGVLGVVDKPVSHDELSVAAAVIHKKNPAVRVFVRADGQVKYRNVVQVMDQVKAQGFDKVNLATEEIESGGVR